jgi:hypothetical protein
MTEEKSLEDKLGVECIAVYEPTGVHYCHKKQLYGQDLVCYYSSLMLDKEFDINRCNYEQLKDINLGDC